MTNFEPDINHRVWQVVACIPTGKVTTYGEVALRAGLGRAARRVGYALRDLPIDSNIPWHRVVNAQGKISLPENSTAHQVQRDRLIHEGVSFGTNGKINLKQYKW